MIQDALLNLSTFCDSLQHALIISGIFLAAILLTALTDQR